MIISNLDESMFWKFLTISSKAKTNEKRFESELKTEKSEDKLDGLSNLSALGLARAH